LAQIERGPRSDRREATPSGTLIIGQGIQVKGEIESCQSLIVEGRVEASVTAESLQVLKGGLFKGTAEVERADIAGTFEGTLTVHGQLGIKANGRASGRVRYGRITVEGGGEISGDVATGADADAPVKKSKRAQDRLA
jgi:cytoskeletal protein CcmA (bactofilin family)